MKKKSITREEIRNDILHLNEHHILCELPTGTGKCKIALDFINEKKIKGNILIVIPRNVLKDNWLQEFDKWHYSSLKDKVTFVTYVSLPKLAGNTYDIVIYDEAHHLSERARLGAEEVSSNYVLLLSATVKKTLKKELRTLWHNLKSYTITLKDAIDDNVLPDPKIILMPLNLNNTIVNDSFIVNPKAKGPIIEKPFIHRFNCMKDKTHKYLIKCTNKQHYDTISYWVDRWRKLYMSTCNKNYYFLWQQRAGERLKLLAKVKESVTLSILNKLQNYRTLTFCSTIEQTQVLGEYCINSKEQNAIEYLDKFNKGEVDHITACNMINEGINVVNCQIGLFNVINSSDIMTVQKVGRILRHKQPIIIIPYYKETREEEIVNEIVKMFNSNLITIVNNIMELENEICNR